MSKKKYQRAKSQPSKKYSKKNTPPSAQTDAQNQTNMRQTKCKHLWKIRVVALLQVWRTKTGDVLSRCSALSKTRWFPPLIICMLGFSLIAIGGGFSFANRIREMPMWSKTAPMVMVACDKPLKGAMIFSSTEDGGKTTLSFFQENTANILSDNTDFNSNQPSTQVKDDTEEYHLWVCILSAKETPINWSFDSRTGNVKNYQITQPIPGNSCYFETKKSNRSQGSDYETAFRISFGGENFPVAQIVLSERADHAVFRGNGYYLPRLPWISPWNGHTVDSSMDDFMSRDKDISKPDILRLTIDNEQMYLPLIEINSSYSSLSLINNPNLEISMIKPEPEDGYPLIRWHSYFYFLPTVQFYDREWESTAKKNTLLGGVFIGLGVNILLTSFDYLLKERRPR